MKGYRTPLVILAVLLVLAGLAFWDEKKTISDKKLSEEKSKLYDFNSEDIVQISVKNTNVQPNAWTLKKDADGKSWKLSSPIAYAADTNGISRFLKVLEEAKFERTFALGDKGLAAYALDTPLLSYTLSDKNGKTWLFDLGGKSPTGYSSYAKTADNAHVFMVNQYLYTASNKRLTDFRDRTLFISPAKDVLALEVVWPQMPAMKVERKGKDWQMVTPLATKADATEFSKYLNAWEQVRVLDFIDSPPPALKQALTDLGHGTKEYVSVRFQGQAEGLSQTVFDKRVQILENNDKLYVKLSDESFGELDKAQVDSLKRSVNDLQDRTLFKFVSADVYELSIDGKVYLKTKDDWFEKTNNKPADFAQGVVVSLEFAKADSKLTAAEGVSLTQGPAHHVVEIKEKGKAPTQFSIWNRAPDGSQLVLKTGDNYYGVSAEFMDVLKPRAPEAPPTLGGELKGEKS